MKIYFSYALPRPKPKDGDRKIVKGVEYVRRWTRVRSGPDRGCLVTSRGKPVYEWMRADSEAP